MTRATHHPLKRLVESSLGPLVIELTGPMVTIRPYRCRKALVQASYAEVVHAVLLQRAPSRKRRKAS